MNLSKQRFHSGWIGEAEAEDVHIPAGAVILEGQLTIPSNAVGLVVFAHGSGSSRTSPRNQSVARILEARKLGTLLFDLLTREEESRDAAAHHLRFDISLLCTRLIRATRWLAARHTELPIGFFGASTGAAAALRAAAELAPNIGAVVSRGGRPDLAGKALLRVEAPTLLIVGGEDDAVARLNQEAYGLMRCEREIHVVPGATHLFEEPGALEEVARVTADWFCRHLARGAAIPVAEAERDR